MKAKIILKGSRDIRIVLKSKVYTKDKFSAEGSV